MNQDRLPSPQPSFESQPVSPDHGELAPNPETIGEQSHEREQNMQQIDRQTAPVPVIPLPVPQPVPVPVQQTQAADEPVGPVLASDDDLIEKEWVDKAKKIIADTKNDPYKREKEVTRLQIDYLRKRYGKELGTSN